MADWYAASVKRSDVIAAVNSAADNGDTVHIPTGEEEWDSTISTAKGITFQGDGINRTIIRDNVQGTGNTTSPVFNLGTVSGRSNRITGIGFGQGSRTSYHSKGLIRIAGTSHNIRIDNCRFTTAYARAITTNDWALGVVDHCAFEITGRTVFHFSAITWGGYSQGRGSWGAYDTMGTADSFYVEDCTFVNPSGGVSEACDSEGGARWVLRHNTLVRGKMGMHGPEGGIDQGTRQFEIYDNDFGNGGGFNNVINVRSGSGVVFNNTAANYGQFVDLNFFRARTDTYYWGIADGRNAWDDNLPGGPFLSGSHTGGNDSATMTDSTKTWTTDQWKGYSILNTTTGRASVVMSNNSNTITEWPASSQVPTQGGGLMMLFDTGDTYEFWKIVHGMNMPGMGKGLLLAPNPAPPAFNPQIIEGIYGWNNTMDGSAALIEARKYPFITEGVHYFNNTPKPGYTPYVYPHPLNTDTPPPVTSAPFILHRI